MLQPHHLGARGHQRWYLGWNRRLQQSLLEEIIEPPKQKEMPP